jgi:hypothetical protein
MDEHISKFQTYRPRMFGVAYRMLGSRVDRLDVSSQKRRMFHEISHVVPYTGC